MNNSIIRGRVLFFTKKPDSNEDFSSYKYIEDGGILIKNGIISEVNHFKKIKKKFSKNILIHDHKSRLILPGFIDTHIHFPQLQLIGSYANDLLEWLNKYTFAEEQKYNNLMHAKKMAKLFFKQLINNGTTTASVFCTVHTESAEAFFEESYKNNMLMIGGKVLMDRNAPQKLLESSKIGYENTRKLINKWHGKKRIYYSISPRFAITSTPEQLESVNSLISEFPNCYLQTHLSESQNEISLVKKLFPNCKDYTGVYEKYGFLGSKSLFGHSIHLSNREINILSETDSIAVFCPTSNLFLGSGLFNYKKLVARKKPVRIASGTDIGGGTSYSMLKTMDEGYKILQLQKQNFSPLEAFYQITLGNAKALSLESKVGTLDVGTDADIVVINSKASENIKLRMDTVKNLPEELFVLQTMGDDRIIEQVYIKGKPRKII